VVRQLWADIPEQQRREIYGGPPVPPEAERCRAAVRRDWLKEQGESYSQCRNDARYDGFCWAHATAREREGPEDNPLAGVLTWRAFCIMRLRFGLRDIQRRPRGEVADEFHVTRERICQIEVTALRKLRHPAHKDRVLSICEPGSALWVALYGSDPARWPTPASSMALRIAELERHVATLTRTVETLAGRTGRSDE